VWVTSGRRSAAYQQELLDEAVRRYGSLSEALRYVATQETSAHVTGDAVDIGPTETADWMVRHGADHGLCQTYANEVWHVEPATVPGGTCPAPRPDAAS
jgi:D-alanyl-D-alanine carboxypeptidase